MIYYPAISSVFHRAGFMMVAIAIKSPTIPMLQVTIDHVAIGGFLRVSLFKQEALSGMQEFALTKVFTAHVVLLLIANHYLYYLKLL